MNLSVKKETKEKKKNYCWEKNTKIGWGGGGLDDDDDGEYKT